MLSNDFKNKIRSIIALMLSSALIACSTPKPAPAWPTGKERPINQVQISNNKKEVTK